MVFTELALAKNIMHSNFGRLSRPYKLTFAVTYNCNSRCTTCGIWKRKPENELSTREIREFFQKNQCFNWIDLTGGEIFLRDDIEQVFDTVIENTKNLYSLHFPTNGLMPERVWQVTKSAAEKVKGRLIVTVSLDGPPPVHEKIRGVSGGWGKAVETFRRLREIDGVEVYFGMTLSAANVGLVGETVSSVENEVAGVTHRDFHVNIAHTSSHFYGDGGAGDLPKDEAAREISAFRRKKGWASPVLFLEQKYLSKVPSYLSSGKTPLACKAASVSCFIDPAGTVYPCTMWDKPLGSLRDVGFELSKLWGSDEFKQAAVKAMKKDCPNCWTPCEAYQTILGNAMGL